MRKFSTAGRLGSYRAAAFDGDAVVTGVDGASGDQEIDAGRIDAVGVGRIGRGLDADSVDGHAPALGWGRGETSGELVRVTPCTRMRVQSSQLISRGRCGIQGSSKGSFLGSTKFRQKYSPLPSMVPDPVMAMSWQSLGRDVVFKTRFGQLHIRQFVAEDKGRSLFDAEIEVAVPTRKGR